jgi:hypothetical protein
MVRTVVLVLLVTASCTAARDKPSLEGPYACGGNTCGTGQICVTLESGSLCGVTEDVPPYTVFSYTCLDLPAACEGIPECDCLSGGGICFGPSDDGRTVAFGCI